jgi:hypothetical protein
MSSYPPNVQDAVGEPSSDSRSSAQVPLPSPPPDAVVHPHAPPSPNPSTAPSLKADPDIGEETRESTGYTQVDWSGCAVEDNGRLYQGYTVGGKWQRYDPWSL